VPLSAPWRRLTRALAFARHVPLSQLLRRVSLTARRKYRDRRGWPKPKADASIRLAAASPKPLFPPRKGMLAFGEAGPTFTFLGRSCPMRGGVDWSAPSLAPRDQLWRMHLHYMEYLEEVDDAAFVDLVEAWIAANSPARAGSWRDSWNSYALSLRVVVWMQQIAARRDRIAPATLSQMTACLAEQIAFLADNLETDIGGNHLIKNIKALIWASAFFEGETARGWRKLGLNALAYALREQVLPDGVHYERSPSYHAQVFADLLECRRALTPGAVPAMLDVALGAMARATADLAHPDGFAAQFNDAGLHMAYRPGECLDAFATLFGRRPLPQRSFAYPSAGYFGRRSGGDYLVIDCGRIGPDALPAHAHGDILSFEWSVGGQRIIVDPGVYEYFQGPRRAAARSAASHNTLCFEGADQADFFGAFRCGRRPEVKVLRREIDDERLILEGTHDGFGRFGAHVRRFEAEGRKLTITDRIEAEPNRRATIGFLVHPEVRIDRLGEAMTLSGGQKRVSVRSTAKIVAEDAVWHPDLGYELATKRLRVTWGGGSGEVVTAFEIEAG
jgi:uncharacterized heparinase superfamily protein